jgi:hypothetical protein
MRTKTAATTLSLMDDEDEDEKVGKSRGKNSRGKKPSTSGEH